MSGEEGWRAWALGCRLGWGLRRGEAAGSAWRNSGQLDMLAASSVQLGAELLCQRCLGGAQPAGRADRHVGAIQVLRAACQVRAWGALRHVRYRKRHRQFFAVRESTAVHAAGCCPT